jgi:isorenieratene synthase
MAGVGGVAITGGAGSLWSVQPRKGWLVPPDVAGAPRVPKPTRVVVIGGGLAGISAATELAERGCDVTLLEQAPHLGGKLGGWTVSALGESFPIEHGFHGFFSQYYNLQSLLDAAGADPTDFTLQTSYPVLFPTGAPERFRNGTSVWPFNLGSVILGSERLHPIEFRDADGLLALMRYQGQATYDALDGVDFATWIAGQRIPAAMTDVCLRPFGDATLNRIERLSTAEAIRFFHFYFLGNPEGMAFRALRRDVMTSVIGPLQARLARLGVRVRTSTAARRLVRDGERIVGVEIGGSTPVSGSVDAGLVSDQPVSVDVGGVPVFVVRRGGVLLAFDARCTHMGCPVRAAADGFHCPCHGGRYDRDGLPVAGPPKQALARWQVEERDGRVVVSSSVASSEVVPLDACVIACEVRGLRAIVAASDVDAAFATRVAALGESEPYAVVRFWFDTPVSPERAPFYTTTQFRYTDSLAVYSAFQEPFMRWAAENHGSVIETHAYAIAAEDLVSIDVLVPRMLEELRGVVPELAQAKVLHVEAQLQSNFSRWAPGDDASRPRTETPHPNLFLAGDHVKIDAPTALMEAAVMSGRLAANAILQPLGVRPVAVPIVSARGVLA